VAGAEGLEVLRTPLSTYPKFITAWSAYELRPLRQQTLPVSATGGGRVCCPARGFGGDETAV